MTRSALSKVEAKVAKVPKECLEFMQAAFSTYENCTRMCVVTLEERFLWSPICNQYVVALEVLVAHPPFYIKQIFCFFDSSSKDLRAAQ